MYDLQNPIRIHVDRIPAARYLRGTEAATAFGEYWVLSGAYPTEVVRETARATRAGIGTREPRPYEADIRNYTVLVEHDYSSDPDSVRYVMWLEGDMVEFYPDAEFDKQIESYIEHEVRDPETGKRATGKRYNELCYMDADDATGPVTTSSRMYFTTDEVRDIYNEDFNRWSFTQARRLGIDISIFEAIERAWFALNQFASFSIATAR